MRLEPARFSEPTRPPVEADLRRPRFAVAVLANDEFDPRVIAVHKRDRVGSLLNLRRTFEVMNRGPA